MCHTLLLVASDAAHLEPVTKCRKTTKLCARTYSEMGRLGASAFSSILVQCTLKAAAAAAAGLALYHSSRVRCCCILLQCSCTSSHNEHCSAVVQKQLEALSVGMRPVLQCNGLRPQHDVRCIPYMLMEFSGVIGGVCPSKPVFRHARKACLFPLTSTLDVMSIHLYLPRTIAVVHSICALPASNASCRMAFLPVPPCAAQHDAASFQHFTNVPACTGCAICVQQQATSAPYARSMHTLFVITPVYTTSSPRNKKHLHDEHTLRQQGRWLKTQH